MNNGDIDYAYALKLLTKINALVVNGREIQEYFIYEGYNFWQAYQTEIFVYAKHFSADSQKTLSRLKQNTRSSFSFLLLLFFISLAAFVLAYVRKVSMIMYSVDKYPQGRYRCDFRLEALYEAASKEGVSSVEMLYAPSGHSLLKNLKLRGRVALYTTGIDFIFAYVYFWVKKKDPILQNGKWGTEAFTAEERVFVEDLVAALEFQFTFVPYRIRWMRWLLRALNIQQAFLIDDAWHYFEFLVATEQNGIRSSAIQHGHFTKYHVGMFPCAPRVSGKHIKPTELFVWTEYWKSELKRLGSYMPQASVIVAGSKGGKPKKIVTVESKKGIGVLIPYETDVPKHTMRMYVQELLNSPEIFIYFKPRPDLDLNEQLAQYGITRDMARVQVCESIQEFQSRIGVALGTYTTLLYDMIGYHIPVILATDVLDYGEGMIVNGLAELVVSPSQLVPTLRRASKTDLQVLNNRVEKLYGTTSRTLVLTLRDSIARLHT